MKILHNRLLAINNNLCDIHCLCSVTFGLRTGCKLCHNVSKNFWSPRLDRMNVHLLHTAAIVVHC